MMTIPFTDPTMIKIHRASRLYSRLKWLSFTLVFLEVVSYPLLSKLDEIYSGSVVPPVIFYPVLFVGYSAPVLWLGVFIWSIFLVRMRALWLLFGTPVIFSTFAGFYFLAMWSSYSNHCNSLPRQYVMVHQIVPPYGMSRVSVAACAGP